MEVATPKKEPLPTVGGNTSQKPRKGGFSKGGFFRVKCHAQGTKKGLSYWAQHVHLALRAPQPRKAYILQKPSSKNPLFMVPEHSETPLGTVRCCFPHLPVVNKFLRFWASQTDWNWLKLIKIDWSWLKLIKHDRKSIDNRQESGGKPLKSPKIGFGHFAWKVDTLKLLWGRNLLYS